MTKLWLACLLEPFRISRHFSNGWLVRGDHKGGQGLAFRYMAHELGALDRELNVCREHIHGESCARTLEPAQRHTEVIGEISWVYRGLNQWVAGFDVLHNVAISNNYSAL